MDYILLATKENPKNFYSAYKVWKCYVDGSTECTVPYETIISTLGRPRILNNSRTSAEGIPVIPVINDKHDYNGSSVLVVDSKILNGRKIQFSAKTFGLKEGEAGKPVILIKDEWALIVDMSKSRTSYILERDGDVPKKITGAEAKTYLNLLELEDLELLVHALPCSRNSTVFGALRALKKNFILVESAAYAGISELLISINQEHPKLQVDMSGDVLLHELLCCEKSQLDEIERLSTSSRWQYCKFLMCLSLLERIDPGFHKKDFLCAHIVGIDYSYSMVECLLFCKEFGLDYSRLREYLPRLFASQCQGTTNLEATSMLYSYYSALERVFQAYPEAKEFANFFPADPSLMECRITNLGCFVKKILSNPSISAVEDGFMLFSPSSSAELYQDALALGYGGDFQMAVLFIRPEDAPNKPYVTFIKSLNGGIMFQYDSSSTVPQSILDKAQKLMKKQGSH